MLTIDTCLHKTPGSKYQLPKWGPSVNKFCLLREEHPVNLSMLQSKITGTFLVVQRLRLCPSTTGGTGLIPGQGIKVLQAMQSGQ